MVIRGPGQNPNIIKPGVGGGGQPAAGGGQPTPTDAAVRLGLFKPGMDAGGALKSLLSFFMIAGFVPPKMDGSKAGGDDAAKLQEALKNLQGKEGLPQTGKLDDKTLKAAEKYKPAQPTTERPAERQVATQMQQQASRSANSFRDQNLAAWIKNKAAELQKPSTPQQPPTSDAAKAQPQTQSSQTQRPDPANQASKSQDNNASTTTQQKQEAANPSALKSEGGDAKATKETGGSQQSHNQGGQGQQGSGEAGGKTRTTGKGTGSAEETPGGRSTSEEGLARGDADELSAFEDGRGNQATGDEDEEDERRGAALVDDGSGVDEGAYEIPSVSQQLRDALQGLTMEKGANNKTTTYTGEFKFYRPGVYQSATQAPMLLNLKVVNATAYDEVWGRCLEQINARLRVFEPEAPALTAESISSALALARARHQG